MIKLADFGLAKSFEKASSHHTPGVVTRYYRAPEVLFGSTSYDESIDMWSLGCIFAELIIKAPLFGGTTDIDMLGRIFTVRGTPNVRISPSN